VSDAALRSARAACRKDAWGEAYQAFSSVGAALAVEDIEQFATCAYLTGRDDRAFELWGRAHRLRVDADDAAGAVRAAFWLACTLGFKGDLARAGGWTERARRAAESLSGDCVEQGHVAYLEALGAIFDAGDPIAAATWFERSEAIARRCGDRELLTLAGIGVGRCRIFAGDIAAGFRLLDEAMLSVEDGAVSAIVVGDAFCTVIEACHELFDVRRNETWTAAFTAWCGAHPDVVVYGGHCLLHRAEILTLHGEWPAALAEAERACERLTEPMHPVALGSAWYVRGELLRLRGRTNDAEDAFDRAHRVGHSPEPGRSLLRFAQGARDVATSAIGRALRERDDPPGRARVLPAYVDIMVRAGDVASASVGAGELSALGEHLGSHLVRAAGARATGAVAIAENDPARALVDLRRAHRLWRELRAPYEAARTCDLLADACAALGDRDGAQLERSAAREAYARLGAAEASVDSADDGPVIAPDGLTRREMEVIALVATGKSNRAIARELSISEKTVASHLTHIFTKLDLTSRAALTAYAYEHRVV
jgi:DNA-binding CsgD family transcriptional regulator